MRPIPSEATEQFGAFTTSQAMGAGWSISEMKTALRRGHLLRLRPTVLVTTEAMAGVGPDADRRRLAARTAAGVLCHAGSTASHRASAILAGLPTLSVPATPCLTLPPGRHSAAHDLHLHRARLSPTDIAMSGRVRRTSSARTSLDVARELGVYEGVVVADAALHRSMTTRAQLQAALAQTRGWPGSQHAAAMVSLSTAFSESPLESISRLRMIDTSLPSPRLQACIIVGGVQIARSDFLWEEFGVVGEADGLDKYSAHFPAALRNEKLRQEALERCGLIVVRWGWVDVQSQSAFAQVTARLQWAFGRAAALGSFSDSASKLWRVA